MAGVADAAANQDGTKCSLGQKSQSAITRKARSGRIAVHLADFACAIDVDLFADKGRKREDFVKIANAAEEVLVSKQLVEAIGTQMAGATEEKLGCTGAIRAEGGTSACNQENGVFLKNRMKKAV